MIFDDYTLNIPSFYEFGAYIAKFDTSGVFQWAKHFGVDGWDSHVQVFDLQIINNNNIVLAGRSFTQSVASQVFFQNAPTLNGNEWGGDDFFIVNYDSLGNVNWHDITEDYGYEAPTCIVNDSSNIYVAGTFNNNMYFAGDTITTSGSYEVMLLAYSISGAELWIQSAHGSSVDQATDLEIDNQGNLYLCGSTYSSSLQFGELNYNLTEPSIFLAKLTPNDVGIEELLNQDILIELYPNPNTGTFSIRSEQNLEQLEIYNLLGEKVFEKHFSKPIKQQEIETRLNTGVYFLLLKTEAGNYTAQKMIVE